MGEADFFSTSPPSTPTCAPPTLCCGVAWAELLLSPRHRAPRDRGGTTSSCTGSFSPSRRASRHPAPKSPLVPLPPTGSSTEPPPCVSLLPKLPRRRAACRRSSCQGIVARAACRPSCRRRAARRPRPKAGAAASSARFLRTAVMLCTGVSFGYEIFELLSNREVIGACPLGRPRAGHPQPRTLPPQALKLVLAPPLV